MKIIYTLKFGEFRITIFVESAGAGGVTCLLVSPLSKGLFHKAIAQSGSYYLKCRDLKKTY